MNKKNKSFARLFNAGVLSSMIFLISSSFCYADDSWYVNNKELLTTNSIILDALRTISWAVTQLVCKLSDVCETLYDKTFGLIDITQYGEVNNLLNEFKPVLVSITAICILALGITLIVSREKRSNLLRNILIFGLVITCSLYAFNSLNNLAFSFKSGVLGSEDFASQSYSLVDANIIDLVRQDTEGNINDLNYKKGRVNVVGAYISDNQSLSSINYTETLNFSNASKGQSLYEWSDVFNDYIKYDVVTVKGNTVKTEKESGWFTTTIGNEFYYRYHFDFFTCILQLIALIVVFIALSYKNVRIAYELLVSRVLSFLFAGDVSSGEKIKGILLFIRDTYITLCISVLCVKLYSVMTSYLTATGISGLTKGIISLFIAFAVIDGPNIVERILGMDVGLRSSFGRTWAAATAGVAVGKAAARGSKNIVGAAVTGKTHRERVANRGGAGMGEAAVVAARQKITQRHSNNNAKGTENSINDEMPVKSTTDNSENFASSGRETVGQSAADQQINKMNKAGAKKNNSVKQVNTVSKSRWKSVNKNMTTLNNANKKERSKK